MACDGCTQAHNVDYRKQAVRMEQAAESINLDQVAEDVLAAEEEAPPNEEGAEGPPKRRRRRRSFDGVLVFYTCKWPGCTHGGPAYEAVRAHYAQHVADPAWPCACDGCTELRASGHPPAAVPEGKLRHRCGKCDALQPTWRALLQHNAHVHGGALHACPQEGCPALFDSAEPLQNHLAADHAPAIAFACPHASCEESCGTLVELQEHERSHAAFGLAVCTFYGCGVATASLDELAAHLEAHLACAYVCRYHACGLAFAHATALRDHAKLAHGYDPADDGPAALRTCPFHGCGRVCSSRGSYSCHLRVHTASKPFVCGLCGRAFKQKRVLTQHQQTHGGAPRDKPRKQYVCPWPECGAVYGTKSGLDAHMLGHTNTRPFVCEHCGAAFKQRCTLNEHINLHTNMRPFRCEVPGCGAAFNYRSNLRLHRRVHLKSGEVREPYVQQGPASLG